MPGSDPGPEVDSRPGYQALEPATLLKLDAEGADPETARSVELGLSPGDGSIPEPYLI